MRFSITLFLLVSLYLAGLGWMGLTEIIASMRFRYRPLIFLGLHHILVLALWTLVIVDPIGKGAYFTDALVLLVVIFAAIVLNTFYMRRLAIDATLQERGITKRMIYFLQQQAPR